MQLQHTNSQYHLPELGKTLASQANRAGVAERLPAPAGQPSSEVDRARLGDYDQSRNARALPSVHTAKPQQAQTLAGCPLSPRLAKAGAIPLAHSMGRAWRKTMGRAKPGRLDPSMSACQLLHVTACDGRRSPNMAQRLAERRECALSLTGRARDAPAPPAWAGLSPAAWHA